MTRKTTTLLLDCIAHTVFSKELSEEDAMLMKERGAELYLLAKHHDLSHLLFDAFTKYGVTEKGEELFLTVEKQKLTAIFRSMRLETEQRRIKRALTEAGIFHIPLKGAVIRELYPEAYMRTSCDIDVLVKREDLDAAVAALTEKLSYKAEEKINYHDISLYSPSGLHLELHFSILENIESIDRVLGKVFDYATPETEGSLSAKLTPEFLYFHLLAHASYHFVKGGSGIKPFIDLYLMKEKVECDNEKLSELLRESDLEKFAVGVEELCSVWFGGKEHSRTTLLMQEFILKGGTYGTTDNNAILEQAKAGGKLKHIFSLLFMPYTNMKVLYPVLEKHPILLPICHVRRWFRIIFKGSFKKSVRILKANASVDLEDRKKAEELFDSLGLN